MGLRFGAELEWPDVDRTARLPEGWKWSTTDYTIVNSDGTANDPRGVLQLRGGELNTPVADSPSDLAMKVTSVWAFLNPGHNYRSNLHVHVSKDPTFTLEEVKQIADFTRKWLFGIIDLVDPLTPLLDGHTPGSESHKAAQKRLAHSRQSRHHFVSDERHAKRMKATTLEEALAAECPVSRDGRVQWHLASREAVNLRALRKHGTIEYRHFAGPQTVAEFYRAVVFVEDWTLCALDDADPSDISLIGLPRQVPFDLALEQGWQRTNLSKNTRAEVSRRLLEGI